MGPLRWLTRTLSVGGAIIAASSAYERFLGRESHYPSALSIVSRAFIQVPGLETLGKAIHTVSATLTLWREEPTRFPKPLLGIVRRSRRSAYDTSLEEQLSRLRETRAALPPAYMVWTPEILVHGDVLWLNETIGSLEATSDSDPAVLRVKGLIHGLLQRLDGPSRNYHKCLFHHLLYERLEASMRYQLEDRNAEEARKAAYADVYSETVLRNAFHAEGVRRGANHGVAEFHQMLEDMRLYLIEVPPSATPEFLNGFVDWALSPRRPYATRADMDMRLAELGEPFHLRLGASTATFLRVFLSYSSIGIALEWLLAGKNQFILVPISPEHQSLLRLEDAPPAPATRQQRLALP